MCPSLGHSRSSFQKNVRWLTQHPGRPITIYQVGEIFGTAYMKTASVEKAVNSFRSTGIFPQNPSVFGDEDFMPSSLTERKIEKHPEGIDLGNEAGASCGGQNN